MSKKLVSAYTGWQPLEEVIVGRSYPAEHFECINDANLRNALEKMSAETEEDLDNLQKTIEQYGATVRRPNIMSKDDFAGRIEEENLLPRPPIVPRNIAVTFGETLLVTTPEYWYDEIYNSYGDQVLQCDDNHIAWGANGSCMTRVGRDIFFDNSEHLSSEQTNWIVENAVNYEVRAHECLTDGHSDAVFAILKPGVILTTFHDEDIKYSRDFPGWDLIRLDQPSINRLMKVGAWKSEKHNDIQWYMQGVFNTPILTNFVDEYMTDWVGDISETVFDINCLVLDEEHVIFSNYNKEIFDFCKKHKIEPIICDFRHRYFFDSGISCVTQDIRRKGGCESYL